MPRRLLLLATLAACTPAPTVAPHPPAAPYPEIHDLEVRRESATAALIERARRGPDATRAIRALGRVGDAPALAELRSLLASPATRGEAARALATAKLLGADVGDAEAQILAVWPGTASHDRRALVEALGRLGGPAAISSLAAALRDGPAELREPAAIALGVLGRRGVAFDEAARAALVALADTADLALQYAVAYALAHEPAPGEPREPADAALLRLARAPSAETRMTAVIGLTRRKLDPRRARPAYDAALLDRDFRVRTAAARGLLALADDAATTHLLEWSARSVADPAATHAILTTLEALVDLPQKPAWSRPLGALADAAERARMTLVACRARAVLPRVAAAPTCPGEPAHVATTVTAKTLPDVVLADLRRDPDPRVRAAAVAALLAHKAASSSLRDLLADPSPAVVGTLAEALAGEDPPPVDAELRAALAARARHELTHEVELYASLAAALAAIHGPIDPCTAGLDHPNLAVRAAARVCVAALAGSDPGLQPPREPPRLPPHAPSPGPRLRWRLTTSRGVVDVALDPLAAPWHVASLVALTRAGFYDGLDFHRVVPGFVVQGGDPEGTGWGGPGYAIPSEPTAARFTRGAVGIADAGKDTGGCQFFFMHARAPHLEGRFTWVGEVTRGQAVVDALIFGDVIHRAELLP